MGSVSVAWAGAIIANDSKAVDGGGRCYCVSP